MNKFFSIIFSLILITLLLYGVVLVKSTSNYEKPNFESQKSGEFYFDIENEKIIKSENTDLKVNYLNISDRILSYKGELSIDNQNSETKIFLEKGVFLFNSNSLDNKYYIEANGFNISVNGASTIFIDTNSEKIKLLAIDNKIDVNLTNPKNKEEVFNTHVLYPNQYIFFSPNLNFRIKNADVLRISQLNSMGYFDKSIFYEGKINKAGEQNKTFKDIFFTKEYSSEIEKLFLFISYDFLEKKEKIEKFKKSRFLTIPGENIMIKYDFLVFNSEKKSTYIKNQILKNIVEIFNDKSKTKENSKIIENYISELKKLDENSYFEINSIIKYFLENVNITEKNSGNLREFFLKMINKNNEIIASSENIELNNIYFNYNFVGNPNFNSEIKNFIRTKSKEKMQQTEKNFLVFFLNQIINANLENENIDFENTIDIFEIFSQIGILYYSAENETDLNLKDTIIRTGISNFKNIIHKFLEKMEKNYFNINSNNLLSPKANTSLNKNYVEKFKRSILNINQNFYTKNKNLANYSDSVEFTKYWEDLDKISLALTNYENYLLKYDNSKKGLFENNLQEENFSLNITKTNAVKYLKKFNYIKINESNVEIKGEKFCQYPKNELLKNNKENPTCYQITKMEVGNGDFVDFLLYPNDDNKITNIVINNNSDSSKINNGTYFLDREEENFKNISGSNIDPERQKFENFFVNVIIPSSTEQKITFYEESSNQEEDSFIRTLKNTTFLGKAGTLTKLSNFLKIKYADIKIEKKDNSEYKINIENSTFEYTFEKEKFSGTFNSEYKYNGASLNNFFNAEINLNNFSSSNNFKIKFSGIIKVDDFENAIKNIFSKMETIKKADRIISEKYKENLTDMIYFPSKKIQVTSKNIKIMIVNDEIESIIIFGKNLLEKNEKLSKIEELLK